MGNAAVREQGLNPSIQIRAIRTSSPSSGHMEVAKKSLNPSIQIRAIRTRVPESAEILPAQRGSQSLNTDQGNSDIIHVCVSISKGRSINPSIQIRAIRTLGLASMIGVAYYRSQSSIQIRAIRTHAPEHRARCALHVSIPQYRSGQFGRHRRRALRRQRDPSRLNPSIQIRAIRTFKREKSLLPCRFFSFQRQSFEIPIVLRLLVGSAAFHRDPSQPEGGALADVEDLGGAEERGEVAFERTFEIQGSEEARRRPSWSAGGCCSAPSRARRGGEWRGGRRPGRGGGGSASRSRRRARGTRRDGRPWAFRPGTARFVEVMTFG